MRTCLKCNKKCQYIFCPDCVPDQHSLVRILIFVGHIKVLKAAFLHLTGTTVIRWWMGSDVLYLFMFPPGRGKLTMLLHRLKAYLSEPFISWHWADSEDLAQELKAISYIGKNKIKVEHHVGKNLKVYGKRRHEGFNVAYYHPANETVWSRWVYGVDLSEKLKKLYPDFNWIRLNGENNMAEIFPILDLYVRPNRHDGRSRLKVECELNNIPVVATNTFNPDLDEICKKINTIFMLDQISTTGARD